jgi:hypothetical protein
MFPTTPAAPSWFAPPAPPAPPEPPVVEAAPAAPVPAKGAIVVHRWTDPTGDKQRYGQVLGVIAGDPEPTIVVSWLDVSGPMAASELEVVEEP